MKRHFALGGPFQDCEGQAFRCCEEDLNGRRDWSEPAADDDASQHRLVFCGGNRALVLPNFHWVFDDVVQQIGISADNIVFVGERGGNARVQSLTHKAKSAVDLLFRVAKQALKP